MSQGPNAWQRALLGAAGGVGFAVIPTLAIAAMVLLGGRHVQLRATVFDGLLLLGLYPLGAMLTGALFGLLAPLTRWVWSAALVGIVAIAPLMGAVYVSLESNSHHENELIALAMTVVFGGVLGQAGRDRPKRRRRRKRRPPAG